MPARRRVWVGPLLATLVVAGAATMIGLGIWQLQRLGERQAANQVTRARLAQPALALTGPMAALPEYTPVQASGVYDFANEIVLRNRAHDQEPGVHVITPLRLAGASVAVLVDRGWIPYTQADPAARAPFDNPVGQVTVAGLVRASQERTFFVLPTDPTPSPGGPRLDAWFWPNIPQIQGQLPYPVLSFYVELSPRAGQPTLPISSHDDLDLSDGPHLSYAIQWFSFSAILIAGSLILWRRRH